MRPTSTPRATRTPAQRSAIPAGPSSSLPTRWRSETQPGAPAEWPPVPLRSGRRSPHAAMNHLNIVRGHGPESVRRVYEETHPGVERPRGRSRPDACGATTDGRAAMWWTTVWTDVQNFDHGSVPGAVLSDKQADTVDRLADAAVDRAPPARLRRPDGPKRRASGRCRRRHRLHVLRLEGPPRRRGVLAAPRRTPAGPASTSS